MTENINKKSLELAVEIQIKELFWEGEIHNNETAHLMSDKIINILSQLPNEPVENEYLKGWFSRLEKIINLQIKKMEEK
tara:strand:- start:711 stop:947 length:237 start_codon:yes stop_codon:yes gene_type:complete